MYENAFNNARIEILHSKLSQEEKDNIFINFNQGLIDILIATTIIEVGVNNKDATVIVVNDAQMYGISQIHQLRGRVGRAHKQSYAFLQYQQYNTEEENDQTRKRLERICATTNGFELANYDLQTRGSGSIVSERQSGSSDLKLINWNNKYDLKVAHYAKREAQVTLQKSNFTQEEQNALNVIEKANIKTLN